MEPSPESSIFRPPSEQPPPGGAEPQPQSAGSFSIDIDALYADLRALAAAYLRRESSSVTLQPTALVNEALLRIGSWKTGPAPFAGPSQTSTPSPTPDGAAAGANPLAWRTPEDFFAVASHVMRQVLVDAARRRNALKRGGPGNSGSKQISADTTDSQSVTPDHRPFAARASSFDPDNLVSPAIFARERSADVLLLHEALASLEEMDPRCARLVQLRFYLGLTVAESAEAMGITPSTADDDWRAGKAWLARWLRQRGV